MNEDQKMGWRYALVTAGAVLSSWILHESGHWLAGTVLGNKMAMTLNTTYPVSGSYLAPWHAYVVDAAGPFVTLIEAIVVYFLLRRNYSLMLFPFLLTCLYMRALAGVMNLINPNDEGRLSLALGTDVLFLSVVVTGFLLYLTYQAGKTRGIRLKRILITVGWIMFFSSIVIMGDQFWQRL